MQSYRTERVALTAYTNQSPTLLGVIVLIVDGSARVRARLAARLMAGSAHVIEACGVREALVAMRASMPDAILLDIHLNDELPIAGLMRVKEAAPHARLVVLTNAADGHHREASLRYGAHHFFDKSSEFELAVDLVLGMVCAEGAQP